MVETPDVRRLQHPDFVVLGAPRCGTTSLHHYLDQHPGVAMSRVKEPNFFLFDGPGDPSRPLVEAPDIIAKSVSDPEAYEHLFAGAGPGRSTGEVSVLYLYCERTPELIAGSLPAARLVAVLRHPVDRAYSHFLFTYTGAVDSVRSEFRAAAEREMGLPDTPFGAGTHVLRLGRYGPQIDRYLDVVGRDRLHLILHEDLQERPDEVLADLCRFLDVDPSFDFDTSVAYNGSALRGSTTRMVRQALGGTTSRLKRVLPPGAAGRLGRVRARLRRPGATPPLGAEFRRELAEWFEPSTARVEELVGRDLSHWRR